MDEFSLIDTYFKSIVIPRSDVLFGIGDDAACLQVPMGKQLLVSCDTLVSDVHFLPTWDAYDIAYKAVMVNVSDIAAMAGKPCWLTLALTLPEMNEHWLNRFSAGLRDSLQRFNIALIGGDTTRGPLSMTLTIHGLVDEGKALRRKGARPGDIIYVSGELGGAAFAVELMHLNCVVEHPHQALLLDKLQHPQPRIDLGLYLQQFATAAIDISDGLMADLNHICIASQVGANINLNQIPIHPLVNYYANQNKVEPGMKNALDFALHGGDDYELCFTIAPEGNHQFLTALAKANVNCYAIGVIDAQTGLRGRTLTGECVNLSAKGYTHFS